MRLELTRRGDYAVRAMLALARPDATQLTAGALAEATGIPSGFVTQVMGNLVRAGLVDNRRGRNGGYRLGRSADEVSLLDIVEAVEGDGRRRTCVLRGGPCRRDGECDVHDAFFRAQEAVFGALAGVSLADVTRNPGRMPPDEDERPLPEPAISLLPPAVQALDQAVRGISGELDLDRVLQLIVDRVRELVDAEFAAIGIIDDDGAIERFITSGISDEARARIGALPRGHGLLGLIIRENRSIRTPQIGAHPDSYGFPPNHPPMSSFLGMPITSRGTPVGRLYLTNKRGAAEFHEADQALVEVFALHAGIAIENARLYELVQRLAIVDERERISRDLHDSVIQEIYAQTLALDDVSEIAAGDPGEAGRRVDDAIDALHAVIRDIRNFIFGLRPVLLESGDLGQGLEHLATELRRSGGVAVSVSVEDEQGHLARLPIETVAEVLAIVREALSNVARHARATNCRVILASRPDRLRLEVRDDGRGFNPSIRGDRGHHGLANMRSRGESLGATFEVQSAPGRGTRIIVMFRVQPGPTEEG